MTSFVVDENKFYCPYGEKVEKGAKRVVFSDHCALVMELELDRGVPQTHQQRRKVWNFTDDGYAKYEEESIEGFSINRSLRAYAYSKWVNEFQKILRKCFEKKTVGNKPRQSTRTSSDARNVLKQLAKKGKVQRSVAQSYMVHLIEFETRKRAQMCAERLKRTMSQLSHKEKFSPSGYWKLKAAAGKKPQREMNSVK